MKQVETLSGASTDWTAAACTLDHDGCVVCSDAGIPLQVMSIDGGDALCQDLMGNQTSIAIELVAPVAVGDVLLTHGGVAIGRVGTFDGAPNDGKDGHEIRQ